MQNYTTKQGENLSGILFTHYGKLNSTILAEVLEENQNIAELPLVLPLGTVVVLPQLPSENRDIPVRKLWD